MKKKSQRNRIEELLHCSPAVERDNNGIIEKITFTIKKKYDDTKVLFTFSINELPNNWFKLDNEGIADLFNCEPNYNLYDTKDKSLKKLKPIKDILYNILKNWTLEEIEGIKEDVGENEYYEDYDDFGHSGSWSDLNDTCACGNSRSQCECSDRSYGY